MNNGLMDAQGIQQWILRKLGAPFNKVEIGQDNLDDCIEDACRWFSAKKGFKGNCLLTIPPQKTEITLDDRIDTVLEVTFSASGSDLSYLIDPMFLIDGQIPTDTFGAGLTGGSGGGETGGLLSSYAQVSQYLHMARRILGAEPEWVQRGRTLVIMPPPRAGLLAYIEYKAHKFTVEQLNERDHDLVKRMALAFAKEFVGRVRSKYEAYPGAQGAAVVDGRDLLAEAAQEKEGLMEEIAQSGFPLGFMIG
jgi:hypothetical protein